MILAWLGLLAATLPVGAQDIHSFWRSTRSSLASEPVEATIEDTREPLPYKKYRVEYRSLGGIRIRAFLAIPIRGGEKPHPLPAIVTAPGYGGLQQGIMLEECQRGYAILQIFPKTQGLFGTVEDRRAGKVDMELEATSGRLLSGCLRGM